MKKYLRYKKWYKAIKESGLFDVKYYIFTYPDIRKKGVDPIKHYIKFGANEGRNPSADFDTKFYLFINDDVRQAKINPLAHYLLYGKAEGREPKDFSEVKTSMLSEVLIKKKEATPSVEPSLESKINILIIDGEKGSMSSYYQVEQVAKSLKKAGFFINILKEDSGLKIFDKYDLFMFFRCRYTSVVESIITYANKANKKIIYSCDDLLFSGELEANEFDVFHYIPKANRSKFESLLHDSNKIIINSDIFIGPTEYLADIGRMIVKEKRSFVVRNYPDSTLFEHKFKKEVHQTCNAFYFCESISHQKDFHSIAEVLKNNIEKYNMFHLYIVGKLNIMDFPDLIPYVDKQIFLLPYILPELYYKKLPAYMQKADIVLAPLDLSKKMVHGKSELKYFEAGIFGIPCIASGSDTYKRCITHNFDGLVCYSQNDWAESLEKLILDGEFYNKLSKNVKQIVWQKYSEESKDKNIIDTFVDIIEQYPDLNRRLKNRKNPVFMPAIRNTDRGCRDIERVRIVRNVDINELPNIDISIVTYFSSKWLQAFFESLKKSMYPLDKINIFIMDHSEDTDEQKQMQNQAKAYKNIFKNIEVDFQENLGFGHGHNRNIDKGKSFYTLITNCDLEMDQSTLVSLVSHAINDEDNVASWEARQIPYEHPKYYDPVTLETAWSSAACLLVRRDLFQKVGGFDERFFMYCEDVELSLRFRDFGYKIKYVPKAIVHHFTYDEDMFKPLQAVGSFLGQVFIRYKYGTLQDREDIKHIYRQKRRQLKNKIDFKGTLVQQHKARFKKYSKSFLNEKKKSQLIFPFFGTMHEVHRDGAFYKVSKVNDSTGLVSVIIRIHGENILFLKEAVQSVLNQTYSEVEIIVVEDKTNNHEEYVQKLSSDGINIRYYVNKEGGRNISANIGLEKSKGNYLMFLDFDDLLFADHIETLLQALLTNTHYDAAVSQSWMIYTKYLNRGYMETDYQVFNPSKVSHVNYEQLTKKNYFPIQTVLFKRKLYEQYGGIDEALIGLEDWELWLRYARYAKFFIVPKTTSLFRIRDFSYHNVDKQARQKEAMKMIKEKYGI